MSERDKNVVHIFGGLGNQMFQYAFFIHLSQQGLNASINTEYFNNRSERLRHGSEFLLPQIFDNIEASFHTDWKSKSMYSDTLLWTSIRRLRKLYFKKSNVLDTFDLVTSQNLEKSLSNSGVQHYRDYWQSANYIQTLEKELRSTFKFNTNNLNDTNKTIIKQVEQSNAVGIHVRRGDYLIHKDIYGNICTKYYYANALKIILERVSNPEFYIFSDDLNWCREFFTEMKNVTFVNWNAQNSHFDMYLMSKCKHNIIANSSFSWWGAWLNSNKDKIVLMPKRWNSNGSSDKLKFGDCIQINNNGKN